MNWLNSSECSPPLPKLYIYISVGAVLAIAAQAREVLALLNNLVQEGRGDAAQRLLMGR